MEEEWGSPQFVQQQFKVWYAKNSRTVPSPLDIAHREFAFLTFFGKTMYRHIQFQGIDDLQRYLRQNAPAHSYNSSSYYKDPTADMAKKGWLGADLADPIDSGEIYFEGKKVTRKGPKQSISGGIGFVTEDRKKEGLVGSLSVRKNLTSLMLDKIKTWFFTKDREEKRLAKKSIEEFGIVTPGTEQEIQYLSGGNQQKVILAKWLNVNPKLIIMDEPTRGIDVGAKAEIYNTMRNLVKGGKALIMISSELPEIIGMSDRIVVMHEGEITGEISGSQATEENILMMATGQIKRHLKGSEIDA